VVFCQGCPWRCRYCQNAHLLDAGVTPAIDWQDVSRFLERRRGLLDAVVFSGGEPTAQHALGSAIASARELGYRIGLHTAGCYPQRLAALLPDLDWVGLDIKALPADYPALTGVAGSGDHAWRSLELLCASDAHFEVRVTVHPSLLSPRRLQQLVKRVRAAGARTVMLQTCRTEGMLDPSLGPGTDEWDRAPRRVAD
jgi:pyruvate formate lyase activating enzyme